MPDRENKFWPKVFLVATLCFAETNLIIILVINHRNTGINYFNSLSLVTEEFYRKQDWLKMLNHDDLIYCS